MHMKTFMIFTGLCLTFAGLQAQIQNNGSLRLHAGSQVAILGDITNNGTFVDSGQVVLLSGSTIQDISGTAATVFKNVKLSNATGARLQRNVSVSNSLELDNGPFDLNAFTLTILNSQPAAMSRTNGYVLSERTDNASVLAWQINSTTGAHVFPLGTVSGTYIPFTLNLTAGNIGVFSVATYPTAVNNTPFPTTPVAVTHMLDSNLVDNSVNAVDRFWYLDKNGADGTATMTFTATPSEVGVLSGLVAQRWNESDAGWEKPLPGQSSTATSATVSGVTDFGVWVLTASSHPLPVELLSFDASVNAEVVDMDWTTVSENGSRYFVVEKTIGFFDFTEVVRVEAAGYSNELLHYSAVDLTPYSGWSWYRLKQVDLDGGEMFSDYVAVFFETGTEMTADVYPIPAMPGNINVRLQFCEKGLATLELLDYLGRSEYSMQQQIETETVNIVLPSDIGLTSGIKTIRITLGKNVINKRLIIQ